MLLDPLVQRDYDIITAMRGPDDMSETGAYVKTVTAAVIRHLVGVETGQRNTPHTTIGYWGSWPKGARELVRGAWNSYLRQEHASKAHLGSMEMYYHYFFHVRQGFLALIEAGVPGADAYWLWLETTLSTEEIVLDIHVGDMVASG